MFATRTQSFLYRHVFKPIAFRFDPETVHDQMTQIGSWLGKYPIAQKCARTLWSYQHPMLTQTIGELVFPNPVGLTAGFDKDGHLTEILPDVGFGFVEVGSVTGKPCEGNAKPRLWRLPKTKSLLVYYGLKNDGSEVVSERLLYATHRVPLGVSVAKTNSPETCDVQTGIADYVLAYDRVKTVADYVTINISCPNAFGGEPFTRPELLEQLLCAIDEVKTTKPIFFKMPVDLSLDELETLVDLGLTHQVRGFIFSNLTKQKNGLNIHPSEIQMLQKGGLSGRPLAYRSTQLLGHFFSHVGSSAILIGSGGIFSADDAYEKILHGASLLQLATGMIFEGPQLIGQINLGLVQRLQRDGFRSVHEAIGTSVI